jgi:N-acetylmuramoyl-L-alanine amidase
MQRKRARGTVIRRLLVSAGALAVVLAAGGGLSATVFAATPVNPDAPLYSDGPYEEAKIGKALQPAIDVSGVIKGYVTRGRLAIRLCEFLGLESSTASYFQDVVGQEECFSAVGALYEAKLLTGATSSRFLPDQLVSRAQALVWITDSLGYKLSRDAASKVPFRFSYFDSAEQWLGGFRDRSMVADTLARGVANAYRLGIVDVPSDGCLYPALPLSETDMTTMLDRAFTRAITARTTAPEAVPVKGSYGSLELKSTGPLVWYLEYQLASLKYRPGPLDGVFDIRTRDAVLAFQKVEKLKKDGVVGDSLWEKLATAETPAPKLSEPGTRVEIDLSRQVLFMIIDDQVTEIVHVSTGAPKTATLWGQFAIQKKMPGWVTSSYKTAMFYTSFFDVDHRLAIHGYSEVPVWPASHGCVRVPVWLAKVIYDQLPISTRVYLYK